jgi:hypothetical protein
LTSTGSPEQPRSATDHDPPGAPSRRVGYPCPSPGIRTASLPIEYSIATGNVVETKNIDSADDTHVCFVDIRADNSELGWRMEVQHTDGWSFFDDTEGDRQGDRTGACQDR